MVIYNYLITIIENVVSVIICQFDYTLKNRFIEILKDPQFYFSAVPRRHSNQHAS